MVDEILNKIKTLSEYADQIETVVTDLRHENMELRYENGTLRDRIRELEGRKAS